MYNVNVLGNQRLLKKVHFLHFASITRSSQRNNTTNDGQQYDELRRSENSYNNIELNIE